MLTFPSADAICVKFDRWPMSCLALILCGIVLGSIHAEDPRDAKQVGVLLLEKNRVVSGRITPQADVYSVEQAGGILVIAKQQVVFAGPDMQSVYVHLQDALPKSPRADDHVELARWCLNYRMMPEARFELQAALEIDPSRDDIRRNLNQLDVVMKQPVSTEKKPVKPETPEHRMARMAGVLTGDVETLGGLSRSAGQEFTRKIQPILMHNCTNAACHGPKSEQTFKLNLVVPGSPSMRSTSERNLLALLKYIDRDDPKSSPLWKLLKSNHGAKGSSIFIGAKGKDQLTSFQDWLISLDEGEEGEAGEPTAESKTTRIQDPFAKVQPAAAASESKTRFRKGDPTPKQTSGKASEELGPVSEERVTAKSESTTKSRTKPKPATESPASATDPIVSKVPPKLPDNIVEDPFNPDEFNRQQRIKQGYEVP